MTEEKKRDQLTLKQKIATAATKLEAMRKRDRKADRLLENGQKLILGGLLIEAARKDPTMRDWVLEATKSVTKEAELKQLRPLLTELRGEAASEPEGSPPA